MKSYFFVLFFTISISLCAQDSTYNELVGKYKFPAGSIIEEATVTLTSGVLSMRSAQGVSVLEKMQGDTFNVVSFNGICIFKRNDAKKIVGVHVDASGYIMDGVKDDAGDKSKSLFIQTLTVPEQLTRDVAIIRKEVCAEHRLWESR